MQNRLSMRKFNTGVKAVNHKLIIIVVVVAQLIIVGCGSQDVLLGTRSSYFLTVRDVLALDGEKSQLQAQLLEGDFLRPGPGCIVRFYENGTLFKIAETDRQGVAQVSFQPTQAGDYIFTVEVAPVGLPGNPPPPQKLFVACRDKTARLAIVDLDKTIVASGFGAVLIGNPAPMDISQEVLNKLHQTHTIVYLTHRPDFFGPKSKAWLSENKYPPGPMLMSSVSGFVKGSHAYKSEMVRDLRKKFSNIELGIGDKISDVMVYHENGIKAFLVVQIPESPEPETLETLAHDLQGLPESVHVVTGWDQIDKALFQNASYPPAVLADEINKSAKIIRDNNELKKK